MTQRKVHRAFAAAAAAIAATAVATSLAPNARPRPAAARAPLPPAGAALAAQRFLLAYARAYAGRLAAGDRAMLRVVATPGVAAPLLGEAPDLPQPGGRVGALRMRTLGRLRWAAAATLSFGRTAVLAELVVAREPPGAWRVERFEPSPGR